MGDPIQERMGKDGEGWGGWEESGEKISVLT
jgi:hypothetical protein